MKTYRNLTVATVATVFVLMCLGGYVKAIGAGLACPTWPGCFDDKGFLGNWFPFAEEGVGAWDEPSPALDNYTPHQVFAEWIHRFVAAYVVGPLMLATLWFAWRMKPVNRPIRFFATASVAILPIQVYMGGITVLANLQPVIVTSHLALATLIFGCLVATAMLAHVEVMRAEPPSGKGPGQQTTRASKVLAFFGLKGMAAVTLTAPSDVAYAERPPFKVTDLLNIVKPRILMLLVFVGITSMIVARPTEWSWPLLGWVLLGGTFAAGAANIFNNYYDRDIDAKMNRTKNRALPSGRMTPAMAIVYGLALTAVSMAVFWIYVNPLSAILAASGILFYSHIYTKWLKRATPQNIVIGGAAGAFPALVGWAAVTGEMSFAAALLGGIVFLWTPPHFWALALVYKDDYARGGVPMLPVVKSAKETKLQMLVYTVLLVLASFAFYWPLQVLGLFYFTTAAALGLLFLAYAIQGYYSERNKEQMSLFRYSIVYLSLLYAFMVIDRLYFAHWAI
ncbi:MAG TPA: heme o synthase [Candidatus Thermoplasmatota archaeon]|nr:heme o synthase [Candidatus Thermoplasmatota archaeon]